MFEVAEVGHGLDKDEYKRLEPELHFRLLTLQQQLRPTRHSLIIIVSGVEGAGKGEVVDKFNRWFDSRDVQTHAFWDESDEERERPRFWRYWRSLPARGTVSIMFTSWYSKPIQDRALGTITEAEFESELQRIVNLERMLSQDGAIIVKLWYHLSRSEQKLRLQQDENTHHTKRSPFIELYASFYNEFTIAAERAIRLTDAGFAPWHIIEATDHHYRDLTSGRIVTSSLQERLEQTSPSDSEDVDPEPDAAPESVAAEYQNGLTILDRLDLDQQLDDEEYESRLQAGQQRLNQLTWDMNRLRRNAVIVLEGWDAAGKGSAIRRLTAAIDARLYRVIPIGAPSDEELAHHYLWRFWRQVPRAGFLTIYDRSWYGRVLVERVEGLAKGHQWRRAFHEINNFEEHLTRHGTTVIKFWIHISKDEQLLRFHAREKDPIKQHKITPADWRNQELWNAYEQAANEMIGRTSTRLAPWHLIPGNDKHFARVMIIETVCQRLAEAISKKHPAKKRSRRPS